jgi:hypothetical protein
MRKVLKGLFTFLSTFCLVLVFQNCGGNFSAFKGFGNGDPYEGLSGGNQMEPARVIQACTSTDSLLTGLDVMQEPGGAASFVRLKFTTGDGEQRQDSRLWSESDNIKGEGLFEWRLDDAYVVTSIRLETSSALVQVVDEGVARAIYMSCSARP